MKFLFVAASHRNGGAETHFVTLTRALAAAGHGVEAVVYPDAPIAQSLSGSAVRMHVARFRNAIDLRGYRAIFVAARRLRPDWLVGGTGKEHLGVIMVGRLLRIPVALFRHRPGMNRLAARLVGSLAQRFFAVSEYARRDYIRRGMPPASVQVLPNPVDLERFRPDAVQRAVLMHRIGWKTQAIVLGCFGRMHAGKGIFPLFDSVEAAMAREPRLHCLWVGDGGDAPKLRDCIATSAFARRHHHAGWVADVHSYYNALSMLAIPSVAPETFGRTAVEAQACGVPVLASDIGGVPETLQPGITGLLLPPGDVNAWRDAILALCDQSTRAPLAAAARRFVEGRFGASAVAAHFVRLLDRGGSVCGTGKDRRT